MIALPNSTSLQGSGVIMSTGSGSWSSSSGNLSRGNRPIISGILFLISVHNLVSQPRSKLFCFYRYFTWQHGWNIKEFHFAFT